MNHDFNITMWDTDAIGFTKADSSPFSDEEVEALVNEINSILPSKIQMEEDGIFSSFVVVKTKNYLMRTIDGKVSKKGSSMKSSTRAPYFKDFMHKLGLLLLDNNLEGVLELYTEAVHQIVNITDIQQFATKKSITEKVLNSSRTNELKVRNAIIDSEYVQGDKVYLYYTDNNALALVERYVGNANVKRLLKNLYDCISVFKTVIDVKQFRKYYNKGAQLELFEKFGYGEAPKVKVKKEKKVRKVKV